MEHVPWNMETNVRNTGCGEAQTHVDRPNKWNHPRYSHRAQALRAHRALGPRLTSCTLAWCHVLALLSPTDRVRRAACGVLLASTSNVDVWVAKRVDWIRFGSSPGLPLRGLGREVLLVTSDYSQCYYGAAWLLPTIIPLPTSQWPPVSVCYISYGGLLFGLRHHYPYANPIISHPHSVSNDHGVSRR